jgi:hypothetical protein
VDAGITNKDYVNVANAVIRTHTHELLHQGSGYHIHR